MVKAVGVGLDRGRCVVGLEGWRNKLIVGFEEVDSTVSLTVTVNKERKKKMEASALKRLVEREKAEKRITDQAKAAGFVMGSSVCSLFGSTVYDGKVTLIDAQTGLSVTFSDGDVKQYTIEQLREAIRVGQAAREKAAREKAAREKAAREKARREQEFAATATAQGLGIGTQIYMNFNNDIVVIEVVRYENAEKVVCKYPDGKNYYPSGGSIDAVCKASNEASKEKAARVSFFFFKTFLLISSNFFR